MTLGSCPHVMHPGVSPALLQEQQVLSRGIGMGGQPQPRAVGSAEVPEVQEGRLWEQGGPGEGTASGTHSCHQPHICMDTARLCPTSPKARGANYPDEKLSYPKSSIQPLLTNTAGHATDTSLCDFLGGVPFPSSGPHIFLFLISLLCFLEHQIFPDLP